MYVNDQLFLNPLEVLLAATIVAWLLHRLVDPDVALLEGRMFWPMMAFAVFVVLGLLRARFTGGDTRVAIFEGRAVVYLPIVYILITNLLDERAASTAGCSGWRWSPCRSRASSRCCTTAVCRTPSGTSWRAWPSTRRRST